MSGAEIVGQLRISEVFRSLGGEVRGHRGRAFWRQGDGLNIALDDAKGTWFDHRDSVGGGMVDLVVHVRQCSRREALDYLALLMGAEIDSTPSRGAAAYRSALAEAQQIVAKKHRALDALRVWRDLNQELYFAQRRRILSGRLTGPELAQAMDEGEMAEIKAAIAYDAIDAIEAATWDDLIEVHRADRQGQRRIAA